MECPACGGENPKSNRFCGACGVPLVLSCSGCGTENSASNKYCGGCGAPLQSQPKPEPAQLPPAPPPAGAAPEQMVSPWPTSHEAERRQLTVMFCDLVGSTALSGRLDPEDLQEVMQAYREVCGRAIERFDGHVAKYLGDGVLAYFGYPLAHEEDAERAARAGLAIVDAMAELNDRLALGPDTRLETRIGIATGPVVVGDLGEGDTQERMAVVGETPNIAARLEALARPGQIVIGPLTRRLLGARFVFEDLGAHDLKGVARPIQAFAVESEATKSRISASAADARSPLFGRDEELERLEACWAKAKSGSGQVVLMSGEPGIGKSRLVHAVREIAEVEGGYWIECHGSPYHGNTPLHPFIELLERAIGAARADRPAGRLEKLVVWLARFPLDAAETVPLLAGLLSIDTEGAYPPLELGPRVLKEKTFEAIHALLRAIAARQPILLTLEDLHWVDASTRELLDALIARAAEVPMLLLLTHRPDFPVSWSGGSEHIVPLTVGRLDPEASAAIVRHTAGGKAMSDDVVDQIVTRTDGVPLFVEEMTKMMRESGLLGESEDRHELRGPLPSDAIPETLQDSLMARLDRLAGAKELAQIAATIGRSFTHELIEAVSELETTLLLDGLVALQEAGLIQARGEPPNAIYSFRQALVRETAYQSLLRRRRQHYHRRTAEILERDFPEIASAQPDLLANHFAEAGEVQKAADYFRKAGERAFKRSAAIEAAEHFTRALKQLSRAPASPERTRGEVALWSLLAPARLVTKGYAAEESKEAFEEARALSREIGEPELEFPSAWGVTAYHFIRGNMTVARELGEEMIATAEAADNDGFRVVAISSMGIILFSLGEFERSAEYVDRGLELYDPAAHRPLMHRFGQDVAVLCTAYGGRSRWILGHPDQAIDMVERAVTLAREAKHPFTLATALCTGAGFARLLRGEVEQTRACAEEALAIAAEQRFPYLHARALILIGWCLVQEGQTDAGISRLEEGLAAFRATGALTTVPFGQALLAEALSGAGRIRDGLRVIFNALDHVERTGERDSEAELHRIAGLLRLSEEPSNEAAAEACFERAYTTARRQRALSWELRAATALSEFHHQRGRTELARSALMPVYERFREGAKTADLRRAKSLVALLAGKSL